MKQHDASGRRCSDTRMINCGAYQCCTSLWSGYEIAWEAVMKTNQNLPMPRMYSFQPALPLRSACDAAHCARRAAQSYQVVVAIPDWPDQPPPRRHCRVARPPAPDRSLDRSSITLRTLGRERLACPGRLINFGCHRG
eukprot:6209620-Pleurochrysis_carterae.AAC.1